MKVHLMSRDAAFQPQQELPPQAQVLIEDLGLDSVFDAMSGDDGIMREVAKHALLQGLYLQPETILYRQAVLKDCLNNQDVVRGLYKLALEAEGVRTKGWYGILSHTPGAVLGDGIALLQGLVGLLVRLRQTAESKDLAFESEGFRALFSTLRAELTDSYLTDIQTRLSELRFPWGVNLNAELGPGNIGTAYILRHPPEVKGTWLERLFARHPSEFTYQLDEKDQVGPKILSDMRDRGINRAANAAGQSADHVMSFFWSLRDELAFYLGCVNLHLRLTEKGVPVIFPIPEASSSRRRSCRGLRDAGLALRLDAPLVGSDMEADGKNMVMITGANQGGKSTFLRAVGLAQMMMQCGMFVTAENFRAAVCPGVFTHFRREEDAALKSGKFDEELARMDALADSLEPNSLILFNESFAATNEHEGSEVAGQIVHALRDARVEIFFVTHLSEFGRTLWAENSPMALFLRAERLPDGQRTYRLVPGEPLLTSFGMDLYREVFESS